MVTPDDVPALGRSNISARIRARRVVRGPMAPRTEKGLADLTVDEMVMMAAVNGAAVPARPTWRIKGSSRVDGNRLDQPIEAM